MTLTTVDEFRKKKPAGVRIASEGDSLVVTPRGRTRDLSKTVDSYTAYNRCLVGDRVHEILAALQGVSGRKKLVGKGKAGLWCLLAGALSKRVKALDVDVQRLDPSSDAAWKKHLDIPSIRQIGGLATVFALIGDRPMTLRNATPGLRKLAKKYAR